MLEQIFNSGKPFFVMSAMNNLGEDTFIVMFASDTRSVRGFRNSDFNYLLDEYDFEPEDYKFLHLQSRRFRKEKTGKDVYVFNKIGSNFRNVFKAKTSKPAKLERI